MRKLLDLCCLLLGGLSILAGAGLLMLYWLGPTIGGGLLSGIDPGKPVLFGGAAGVVVGAGIFMVARGGRTWPAWALMIALVTGTFALGQTAERWLPYVPTLGVGGGSSGDTPNVVPVVVAEETEITPEQFLTEHIEPALKAISAYDGYTCNFHKREWAKPLIGKNFRLTDEKISLKVRHEPFSAYLHFDHEAKLDTEALYVEGKNNGNVIAHSTTFAGKFLGTIRVPPTDPKVMADNRYPITNIGLKNLMLKFKKESETHKEALKSVTFTLVKDKKIDERPCKVIEIWNPNPDRYPRSSARLYIDREWNIPVGFESYEKMSGQSEPVLVEYYRYTNLKFNPGLKDLDFDPTNPAYRYPKSPR